MASIKEMREALADTISTGVPRLKAYPRFADVIQVPCFVVGPPAANFAVEVQRGFKTAVMSMGLYGLQEWEFDIYVLVGISEVGVAQDDLDDYLQATGDSSIRQAVFEDNTLGGVVDDAMIVSMGEYGGTYPVTKIPHMGARLKVKILSSGS